MNNFKWQYLVGECKMDTDPIFWKQLLNLPARQYHYGGREATKTHTGYLQSLQPVKNTDNKLNNNPGFR